jgi:nitrogen fixation protein FixH
MSASEGMRGSGRYWPVLIVALLVGGAGANIALMVIATRDASFAVEPDYYDKAVHWDDVMRQESRNAALGWSVAVHFDAASVPGQVRVAARVSDRDGAPVEGATVHVTAFHSARASRILTATLAPESNGSYSAPLPLNRPGVWELRLRVEQGDRVFSQVLDQELPRRP